MGPPSWQERPAIAPAGVGITAAAGRAIAAAAAAARPHEFVALLGGRGDTVEAIVPLPNRAMSAVAFAADPIAFARAEHELRRQGLQFLGFVHSHPGGTPVPSAADRAAFWPACVQLIAAVNARGALALRAYRRTGDDVVELRLSPTIARDDPSPSAPAGALTAADAAASMPLP